MKCIPRIGYGFAILASGLLSNLVAEEGYDEQTSRHATAMEWNALTQRAEQAIRDWLLANRGEEWIPSRRYYEYWNVEQRGGLRYLLVVTSLKPARGNYSVTDLLVIPSDPMAKPIIYEFGDLVDRYIDQVQLKTDGIQIDYFRREQGAYRPSVPARSMLYFSGDTLLEVMAELPDERRRAMNQKLSLEERTAVLEAEAPQMREELEGLRQTIVSDGKYVLRPGDTAARIARNFGLKIDQLFLLNPGVEWTKLKVGQGVRVTPTSPTPP